MTPDEFRAALKAAQITQKKFAEECGVTTHTVSRWAKGHVPLPRWVPLAIKWLVCERGDGDGT